MSKPAEVEALFKETAAAFKDPVSILVNNAGITKDGTCWFACELARRTQEGSQLYSLLPVLPPLSNPNPLILSLFPPPPSSPFSLQAWS